MADATRQLAHQQLQDLDSRFRLVVAHPNYVSQHLLLDALLQAEKCVYVRFEGSDLNQEELQSRLESALAEQLPHHHLNDIRHLVLDEWDRADPLDLDAFLKDVLSRLSKSRIILMGRGMPEFVYHNQDLRPTISYIPTDPTRMLMDYSQYDGKTTLLEVRSLGRGAVRVNGRPILDWGGDLPRSLFFYLVDRGIATRSDIFAEFWPGLSMREATNVFHVTKRKIAEMLGAELTTYWSGFYRISPKIELVYDVALFSEAVQNSDVASGEKAHHLLSNAIQYYKGDYLISLDGTIPWVQKRRQELRETYGEILVTFGKLFEQMESRRDALGLYSRALAINPQREDIAGSMMKIYADLGLHADALSVYQRLENEVSNRWNISPAPWLQKLEAEIRATGKSTVYTR